MNIYLLKKKDADWGYSEDKPQWANVGWTTDIEVLRAWIRSSHRDEKHDYETLAELALVDIT